MTQHFPVTFTLPDERGCNQPRAYFRSLSCMSAATTVNHAARRGHTLTPVCVRLEVSCAVLREMSVSVIIRIFIKGVRMSVTQV